MVYVLIIGPIHAVKRYNVVMYVVPPCMQARRKMRKASPFDSPCLVWTMIMSPAAVWVVVVVVHRRVVAVPLVYVLVNMEDCRLYR